MLLLLKLYVYVLSGAFYDFLKIHSIYGNWASLSVMKTHPSICTIHQRVPQKAFEYMYAMSMFTGFSLVGANYHTVGVIGLQAYGLDPPVLPVEGAESEVKFRKVRCCTCVTPQLLAIIILSRRYR